MNDENLIFRYNNFKTITGKKSLKNSQFELPKQHMDNATGRKDLN